MEREIREDHQKKVLKIKWSKQAESRVEKVDYPPKDLVDSSTVCQSK